MAKNYKIINAGKKAEKINPEMVAKALGAKKMTPEEAQDFYVKNIYTSIALFERSSENNYRIVPTKAYLSDAVLKEVQLSKRKDWLRFDNKHINLAEPFPYKELNELPNTLEQYSDNDLDKFVKLFPSVPKKELEYIRFLEQFLSKKGNYRPESGKLNSEFRNSLDSDDYNMGY